MIFHFKNPFVDTLEISPTRGIFWFVVPNNYFVESVEFKEDKNLLGVLERTCSCAIRVIFVRAASVDLRRVRQITGTISNLTELNLAHRSMVGISVLILPLRI